MAAATAIPPRAFAVRFKELLRWDVSFFRGVSWRWPKEYIRPLQDALVRKRVEVENVADITAIPIIEKITFGGVVSITGVEDRRGYKGRLFWADVGDLVYSKIRVKQGSMAVIPSEIGRIAVSGEYPVYAVNLDKADGRYIELVLRTNAFQHLLAGVSHGGSTKTRIPPEEFEKQLIPLPPLPVQRAIVAHWEHAQQRVEMARTAVQALVVDLNMLLFKKYRATTQRDVLESRALTVSWKDIMRWDVKSARAAAYRLANPTFQPLGEFAEEATEMVKPWEQPDKEWPVYGVNNKGGVFFSHYQKGAEFNAPYKRIRQDWFFHNPTRSSVGSLGLVPEVPADAITSPEYQVWRIKSGLIPGYVAVLINTPFFIELIQFHRVGAVKQRLYVENLLEIRIPSVAMPEQERIANARVKALREAMDATKLLREAETEVEAMILGRASVV